jgi:demethylmenaquinone methyltransferase/2-methoxy-6-polyprenyl-1,4-benzoquinol methylase
MSGADGSGEMFDRIARRYDRLNRVMSLGADAAWRRAAIDALGLGGGERVLDLATGTGELALAIARDDPRARAVGIDPSEQMLAIAAEKARRHGIADRVSFVVGRGESIPAESASFEAAVMAFAACLRELARVVRPGGRVAILELTWPRGHLLSPVARAWNRFVVPGLGTILSSSPEYRYLGRSIRAFPPAERFVQTLREAGLAGVAHRALTFGAATLFVATVPAAWPRQRPASEGSGDSTKG